MRSLLRGCSLLSLLLLLVIGGCADRTNILIEVTSTDLTIPSDIDSLTIEVRTQFGVMFREDYPVRTTWPHSLAVVPPPLEASGDVRIDVTGNLAGVPVTRRVASTSWIAGGTRRVTVVLTRSCLNVLCGDGLDCVNGRCCLGAACSDADAGVDAGMIDGGALPDVPGGFDAGIDAPMSMDDGGLDAGIDAGFDGGRDAGMDAGMDAGSAPDAPITGPIPLIFSEYVEGSSNNKAVEIRNAGAASFDLAAGSCSVIVYSNGSFTASRTIPLTGTLAPGAVQVLCHASAGSELAPRCDALASPPLDFNGDDAVSLECGGTTIDVIGQIGFRPTTEWGSGLTSTADNTLRRRCGASPDTNGSDAFDPASEWAGFATDTFDGLRMPACTP